MSSTPQPTPTSGGLPFTLGDIHNLSTAIAIYRIIGGLEKAVSNLEDANKLNIKKIDRLTHSFLAIPGLERAVAQNAKDLNELGRRHDRDIKELEKIAHTAKTFGKIALVLIGSSVVLAIPILTFLYHHLVFK